MLGLFVVVREMYVICMLKFWLHKIQSSSRVCVSVMLFTVWKLSESSIVANVFYST